MTRVCAHNIVTTLATQAFGSRPLRVGLNVSRRDIWRGFAMRDYVTPTITALAALASLVCVFFIVNAGYLYMTSSGKPEQMDHAKHVP